MLIQSRLKAFCLSIKISIFFLELSTKNNWKAFNYDLYDTKVELRGWRNGIYTFLVNNPSSRDINSMNLPRLTSVLPGDTFGSQNSSLFTFIHVYISLLIYIFIQRSCIHVYWNRSRPPISRRLLVTLTPFFDRGCSFLAQWLHMVVENNGLFRAPIWLWGQRSRSHNKIGLTRLVTRNPLIFWPRVYML